MKRKILTFMLLAATVLAFSQNLWGGVITHTATYNKDDLTVSTTTLGGATYSTVSYDGLFNSGEPGTPWLPIEYLKFSVPYNAVNFSVGATLMNCYDQLLNYPIYPRQASSGNGVTPPNSECYSGNNYPSVVAWVVNEGMLVGENHVVTVAVMPLTCYNLPGSSGLLTLSLARNVQLTLTYELSDTPNMYPLVRKGASLREEGRDITRGVVVNPDDVAANAVPLSSPKIRAQFNVYPEPLDTVENPDTYMIIATDASLRPLRRLAALKMQEGYRVKMVKVNDAVNDPIAQPGDSCYQGADQLLSFCDDAGKLRQYLRKHYLTRGLKYVLLAGAGVPYRTKEGGYADLYFGEFDTDWLCYASTEYEITVGRLLGTTSIQFDNYTDKLLRYKLNPGNGDYSYLTRGLSIESEIYSLGTSDRWNSNFNVTSLGYFANSGEHTGSDVIGMIDSNHYGIVNTFHDGFPSGVKIYEKSDEYQNITTHYIWAIDTVKVAPNVTDIETGNGLNLMNNRDYPMVYVSPMGVTMPYVTIAGYGNGLNYGESFTMGKDYGGPAFMGMTGRDYYHFDYFASTFGDFFFSNMMNGSPLGIALNDAKLSLDIDEHIAVIASGNLLGDPTLGVWTAIPQEYSGITVSRTDNTVTINGITVPRTIISYHSNDGKTGQCEVSTSNVTLTDVSPNSTIMLNKHNFIPYIAPLVLQNTDLEQSQYVFATDVTAGRAVDSGRTNGGVTVKNGAEYEIEASGEVTLAGGFKVELGARFAVKRTTYK
jgi:hypothetical protein